MIVRPQPRAVLKVTGPNNPEPSWEGKVQVVVVLAWRNGARVPNTVTAMSIRPERRPIGMLHGPQNRDPTRSPSIATLTLPRTAPRLRTRSRGVCPSSSVVDYSIPPLHDARPTFRQSLSSIGAGSTFTSKGPFSAPPRQPLSVTNSRVPGASSG